VAFTVYFVQTGHPEAGRDLRRHLVDRYRYKCCRLSDQTHLIATRESPDEVAKGLVRVGGKPRMVKDEVTGIKSLDWTLLVAALAGPRAAALGKTAHVWVFVQFYFAPARAGSGVFVAHWNASGPPWDRRDRPDGYFRNRFRDWIYPGFNTFVLRTRLKADDLHTGIRNKWRGARRKPNGRDMAFVAELAGPHAAYLNPAMTKWLAEKLGRSE
jgi:hypothetical protein